MSDLSPVSFDLTDVDVGRQIEAFDLLERVGAYFELVDGRLSVPARHADAVAAALHPNDDGSAPRWM